MGVTRQEFNEDLKDPAKREAFISGLIHTCFFALCWVGADNIAEDVMFNPLYYTVTLKMIASCFAFMALLHALRCVK